MSHLDKLTRPVNKETALDQVPDNQAEPLGSFFIKILDKNYSFGNRKWPITVKHKSCLIYQIGPIDAQIKKDHLNCKSSSLFNVEDFARILWLNISDDVCFTE